MTPFGGHFSQGYESKTPVRQSWVGYLKSGIVHTLRPIHQNININLTIAPSFGGPSTDLLFNPLQRLQQIEWVQMADKTMRLIQKRIMSHPAPRGCFLNSGGQGRRPQQVNRTEKSPFKVFLAFSDIAAHQQNKPVHPGKFRVYFGALMQ